MFALRRSLRIVSRSATRSLSSTAVVSSIGKRIATSAVCNNVISRQFSLASVLKEEIAHEKEQQQEVDGEYVEMKEKFLKNYNVEEKGGNSRVTLASKQNKAGEKMIIRFGVEDLAEDYGMDDEEVSGNEQEDDFVPGINFNVTIEKGDNKLVFDCAGGVKGLNIRGIR
jgi:hypothetical protein